MPKSTEVACIGSGKTVNITAGTNQAAVVQGEGTLTIEKSSLELTSGSEASNLANLTLYLTATLKGAGTLRVSSSLAWKKESTMAGSGSTVILPGATATTSMELLAKLQRRLVNEGTFTMSSGTLQITEGGEFENAGTFNANTAAAEGITGSKTFLNSGTFQRTTTGSTEVKPPMKNAGTIRAQKGTLAFLGGGSSSASNEWAAEGEINFGGGSFSFTSGTTLSGEMSISGKTTSLSVEGVAAGSAKVEVKKEATFTIASGTMTLDTLTMSGYKGVVGGAGTLKISNNLAWSNESTMSGSGSTILQPGATATTNMELTGTLKKRAFVNEGTFTMSTGTVEVSENAVFENLGTFNVNTTAAKALTGGSKSFLNKGVFRRTVSGSTEITAPFENAGTVTAQKGTLAFAGGGASIGSNEWNGSEGEISFSGTTYTMTTGTTLAGAVAVAGKTTTLVTEGISTSSTKVTVKEEGTLKIPSGTLTLDTLTMSSVRGVVTGAGTLRISSSLAWKNESTMSGAGSTILLPGATGSTTMELAGKVKQRTFVNEGTFTMSTGTVEVTEGGRFENLGTFDANTTASKALSGTGSFANVGTLRRTATGTTKVEMPFENAGTVSATAGVLNFTGGGASISPTEWNASGGEFNFTGGSYALYGGTTFVGPIVIARKGTSVAVAGGSGGSAQVTVKEEATLNLVAGTLTLGALTMGAYRGVVTGAGTLRISNSFAWEKESTMSGAGSTVLLPGATGSTTMELVGTLKQRTFVNEGTFTMSTGSIEESEGAQLRNLGTFNANTTSAKAITGIKTTIFNGGTFQKSSGMGTTEVEPDFENAGVIHEASGHVKILHPVSVKQSNQFGKRCHSGDPVECATGNFSESQTDFAIGGMGVGLVLARTYSAQAAAAAGSMGSFGYGWSGSFSDRLTIEESGAKVTLTKADGSTIPFTKVSGTTYAGPAWSQETLSGSPEAGYTFTRADRVKLTFSGTGRLESVSDRNANKTTLSYNGTGQLTAITDPAGRQIKFAYNGGGQVESAEDPMGHLVKYGYEGGNLTSVTMPGEEGPRWQFKYDASHRITTVTDGRGGKTINEYDGSSRVVSQTDPAGRTLTFEYVPFHTTITNEATGSVTDEWFTSNNEPFSIIRGYETADATTETFTYNEAGQLASQTDGNGHTTTYDYDAEGNKTSERDAQGNESKWSYNAAHEVVSMTSPGGETATINRDGSGNVESISRPGPEETTQTTTIAHNEYGQLESITDPLERTWAFGYNANGDRTSETDSLGHTRSLGYDEDSRLTSVTTPLGNLEGSEPGEYETTFELDPQGRVLKAVDPLGSTTEYAYDGNGNLEEETNANGHTTKYAYNADDEQIRIEKPNGAILETGYDGAGNVTSQTDGNEETTTYVRNALGRPVEVIDPLGRKTIEEFDEAGNLKSAVDPAERKTSYSYDEANRLTGIDYSDEGTPDVGFKYDPDGNVTSMSDGTGESRFEYDQFGRLTESEDGHGDLVRYGYDLAEQLTGIVYPNGKAVSREFDPAGRLESVTDWLGGTTSFAYDADSNLEGIVFPVGTGNVDEYAYDGADRMVEAKFMKGVETLASLSYGRDKLGQVEEETRVGLPGAEEVSYGYDENERLTEAGAEGFEYDPADNLVKGMGSTNAYDAASQLETGTGVTYSYDKLGERTEAAPVSGPSTSYEYDQAGNLTAVERSAEGETPAIEEGFAYDGTGLLASKTSGEAVSHLTWDASRRMPLLLDDENNSYVYGPGGLPVEQINSEEATHLHHDQLSSTRLLTDVEGKITGTFTYAPYGALEGRTGTSTTPLGFAGQYTNNQSGTQYLRARFYEPATGQFMTRDPLVALTRAPYNYANVNPVNTSDPTGLGPCILGFIACDESDDPCDSPVTTNLLMPLCLIPEEGSEAVTNTSAGIGDSILSPIPFVQLPINGSAARDFLDINNVNECSFAYTAGNLAGELISLGKGVRGIAKHAPGIWRDASKHLDEKFVHLPHEISP
ncbi:MAG TPA: RHS repeat-associated core domain-containing protein [Solirubrobacterales bacterium]